LKSTPKQAMSRNTSKPRGPAPSKAMAAAEVQLQPLLTGSRTAVILLLLFLLGVVLRWQHWNDVTSRTPDEKTYTFHARRILSGGLSQFPIMVREYNADRQLALLPSPVRAGWDVLLSGAMWMSGITDERAGAALSCLLSIATLALLGFVGSRFLPPWAAIYGMLYMAVSVPDLTIARRCWQDALMGALGLLLVWCACEITRNPDGWWHYSLFVAAGSYSVLVKELGAFVYGGCVIYVLVLLYRRRAWQTMAALAAGGLAGAALSVYCLISVAGGLTPLLTVYQHLNEATYTNPYCVEYQGGPWYLSIWGLWILSPLNLLLWAFATLLSLRPQDRLIKLIPFRPLELQCFRLFSWMSAMLLATILILPNSQSFRFLAPVYGPMYLMGGIGLWGLLHLAGRKMHGRAYQAVCGIAVVVALAGAVAEYQEFIRVYVTGQAPDLSVKYVIDTRTL